MAGLFSPASYTIPKETVPHCVEKEREKDAVSKAKTDMFEFYE
jgi:hypothetical protein